MQAVSLGEMRSATPVIRAILARGEKVILTHITAAGRREAMRELGPEITEGALQTLWVPFEISFARVLNHHANIRHAVPIGRLRLYPEPIRNKV